MTYDSAHTHLVEMEQVLESLALEMTSHELRFQSNRFARPDPLRRCSVALIIVKNSERKRELISKFEKDYVKSELMLGKYSNVISIL